MVAAPRVLALAALLASCAPSGDDPRSRLTTWDAPTGDYRIRYLEPPWRLLRESPEGALFLVESTVMMTGRVDGGPGKFELRTSRVRRGVADEMDHEVSESRRVAGRRILEGPREITTVEGVEGLELNTFDPPDPFERYRRVVLFALPSGLTLRLDFEATPPLDTPEVTAMIRQVGIGPAP